MANSELFFSRPKYFLLDGITPIQELTELNKQLLGVKIYVKRDDLMGVGLGGNKLRKLEYLLGDALHQGADHIITTGAIQSNHARLTAAACAKAGLSCDLVLNQAVDINTSDYTESGNTILNHIFGAHIFNLKKKANSLEFAENRMRELRKSGKNPYLIPTGGSSPIGCLGYAECAIEILRQSKELGTQFSHIVVPNGSSGTHAGLLAGLTLAREKTTKVRSYNVLAPAGDAVNNTFRKASEAVKLLDKTLDVFLENVDVSDDYLGKGYGIHTPEMMAALLLLARTEGILLDPVYSGKAFAGLLGDIRDGLYKKGANILYILTGGSPGVFAYKSLFTDL